MKLSCSLLFAVQVLSVLALPAPNKAQQGEGAVATTAAEAGAAASTTAAAEAGATKGAEAGAGAGAEAGKEEGAENEIAQEGQFDQIIALGGGDIKTDTTFPPGTNGVLEVEFQNKDARQLRVTENKTPAAAPAGFTALEPVSYKVELAGGAAAAQGLTLQKIDYIRNADSTVDISKGQVARFCAEANSFVFGEGELEFEADENELTLTVNNMVGEFAFFVPQAAAEGEAGGEAGAGAGEGAEAGAGEGAEAGAGGEAGAGEGAGAGAGAGCGAGTTCRALLDALEQLIGNGGQAGGQAKAEK